MTSDFRVGRESKMTQKSDTRGQIVGHGKVDGKSLKLSDVIYGRSQYCNLHLEA